MQCMEAPTEVTRRVLVVCRDARNSRAIEEATQPWMFETASCSSIEESTRLLQQKDFALIFCEESSEDGNYRDLLSVARAYRVPVVVLISDTNQDFLFRQAMTSGAFGVIPSPCSRKDVQWTVIRATQKASVGRSSL
jgi:DNA-binding NtrC family response regulator